MKIINGIHSIISPLKNTLCIIGNFDAMHLGHIKLFEFAKNLAIKKKLHFTVITFEPHSKIQISGSPLKRLISLRHKMVLFKLNGADTAIMIRPSDKIMTLSPQHFIDEILLKKLDIKAFVIGEDFRFGYKKQGSIHDLQNKNFEIITHKTYLNPLGKKFSSSKIKASINEERFLNNDDTNYSIIGKVVPGNKLARTIGFPTANIDVRNLILPKLGVYKAKVTTEKFSQYDAIANLGIKPTISKTHAPILETHIFNFTQDIYGKTVKVELLKFLRNEKKFQNIEELKRQIHEDCKSLQENQPHNM